jgi:hypothetical protein
MGPPFVIDENFRLIGCRGNETRQIGEHSAKHFGLAAATHLLDCSLTDVSEIDADLTTSAGDRPPFNTIDWRGPYT